MRSLRPALLRLSFLVMGACAPAVAMTPARAVRPNAVAPSASMSWADQELLLLSLEPHPSSPSGPASAATVARDEAPQPCARDEDCWSRTCCPAVAPEQCVHAVRAQRCAIVDVQCPTDDRPRFTCFCRDGQCDGRARPGTAPSALPAPE